MAYRQKGRENYQYSFRYRGRRYQGCLDTMSKREAYIREAKIRNKVVEGKYYEKLPGDHKTFSEMMEKFIEEHGRNVSSGMKKHYGYVKKPLLKTFGKKLVSEISSRAISKYKTTRRKAGVSGSTINNELKVLSKAFSLAVKEWEWVRENPVSRVSREKPNPPRDRWLTKEQASNLISVCESPLKEIVIFALSTGLRKGEIFNLEWKDIDREKGTVLVRKSKNGKPRIIPLSEEALMVLHKMDKVRHLRSNLVFPNGNGNQFSNKTLHNAFNRALKEAGFEDIHFHDLRHTCATWLVQDGNDIYLIEKWLGHLDPRMTRRYAHHSAESLRRGVQSVQIDSQMTPKVQIG